MFVSDACLTVAGGGAALVLFVHQPVDQNHLTNKPTGESQSKPGIKIGRSYL